MTFPWPLSACLRCRGPEFVAAVREAGRLGFTRVDLLARPDARPTEELEALADSGVVVACAVLELPQPDCLQVKDISIRRAAVEVVQLQIADAAHLGATCVSLSVMSVRDESELLRLNEALTVLAEYAGRRMMVLGIENGPEGLPWEHSNLGGVLTGRGQGKQRSERVVHVRVEQREDIAEVEDELRKSGYRGVSAVEQGRTR